MECHHAVPLRQLDPAKRHVFRNLALVCANCHSTHHPCGRTIDVRVSRALRSTKDREHPRSHSTFTGPADGVHSSRLV